MDITLTSTDRNSLLRNQVNGVSGGNRNTNETTDVPTITRGTGSERVRTDQITGPLSSNPGSDRSNRGGELRGLDRADQVAGEQGRQGRDIAADNQQSQPGFHEIRSDLRDLGRNLRDVREAAAELRRDFRSNASSGEIRSDVRALMSELKDVYKDRRELRADIRDLRQMLSEDPRTHQEMNEVRSDFRDLGRNLKDVREAAAELRRDLRSNASPEEIRSDLKALMGELKDVARDRSELQASLRDLRQNIPANSDMRQDIREVVRLDVRDTARDQRSLRDNRDAREFTHESGEKPAQRPAR